MGKLISNPAPPLPSLLPFITVSAEGVANGLSTEYNGGADFGPDTPNSTGTGLTQTGGLKEAINYAISYAYKNKIYNGNGLSLPTIEIIGGEIYLNEPFTISSAWTGHTIGNLKITGQSSMSPYIYVNIPAGTSTSINYAITLDPSSFSFTAIEIDNIQPASPTGNYNYTGFLNMDFSTINNGSNGFQSYNWDGSNGGFVGLNALGFQLIYLFNFQNYGADNYLNADLIQTIGGSSGRIYASGGSIYDYGGILTVNGNTSLYYSTAGGYNNQYIYSGTTDTYTVDTMIFDSFSFTHFNAAITFENSSGTITINNLIMKNGFYPDNLTGNNNFIVQFGGGNHIINHVEIENVMPNTSGYTWVNLPTQSTTDGTTAGTVFMDMPFNRSNYKKIVITFTGYENDSTTNQTINYPFKFNSYAVISANNTGLTVSTTTTGITITAPDSTTTYSGIVIVEGY